MKKTLLASAVLAASAAVSQAAVVGTLVKLGTPSDAFGDGPLTGYTAYLVHLTSTTGNITGVDFSAAGNPGKPIAAQNHEIHQDWQTTKKNVVTPSPTGVYTSGEGADLYDSFFILPGGSDTFINVGSSAVEDNDKTTSPFASSNAPVNTAGDLYGGGNQLAFAYGLQPPVQSTSYDVAYVVLKNTYTGINGLLASPEVATANGTFTVPIPVPEPTTLGLAGLGLLGLARRRRA